MRGKNRKKHLYVGKRSARMSFLAGIGAGFMILAATVCVALAVFIMMDYSIPAGDAQPVFVYTPQIVELPQAEVLAATPSPTPTPTPAEPEEAPTYADMLSEPDENRFIEPVITATPEPTATPAPTPSPTPAPPQHQLPARVANMTAFSVLPFYIPEKAAIYAEFYAQRPDLDIETVVWKVNVSLNHTFYTNIQINHDPNPLLISPFFRLPVGFSPAETVPVNSDTCHLRATPQTVAAFHSLRSAAWQAGFDLSVTSAYRTAVRQNELWVNGGRRDGRIARPYHSEHQTGRALDLWGPTGLLDSGGPTPTGLWVGANAHYHGFIVRYLAETTHITGYIHEPWHITYVGLYISMYMHNNNILSLEEFVGRNPWITLN